MKTSGEREERWFEPRPERGRKWNEKRSGQRRLFKTAMEVRPSNTPSSRDSIGFEFKSVLKK